MSAALGSVDVELIVMGWLRAGLPPGTVVRDELDNQLADELPTVQVQVIDGDDDGLRLDRALLSTDVYAATRADAIAMAAQVRALLMALQGSAVGGAQVGAVRTVSRPAIRPYENTGLRRVGATYELYVHPVS